jgi:hypothetical protein
LCGCEAIQSGFLGYTTGLDKAFKSSLVKRSRLRGVWQPCALLVAPHTWPPSVMLGLGMVVCHPAINWLRRFPCTQRAVQCNVLQREVMGLRNCQA